MYSGKINFDGTSTTVIRDVWTYFIRYVLDSTYWTITTTEIATGGIATYSVSDSVTATALDTAYDLSSAGKVSALTAIDGSTTLVEGTDYTVDYDTGRITFLSTGTIVVATDVITVAYTWSRTGYVLYSTGISTTEKIYIGFRPYINSDGVNGYIEHKAYKLWQTGMVWSDVTFGNPLNHYIPLWEGITDLWLFVNIQRVIAVNLIQTFYQSIYVGFANRLLMPHEYNYPLVIIGSGSSAYTTAGAYIASPSIREYVDWTNSWVQNAAIVPTQVDTGNQIQVHYPVGVNRAILPLYSGYFQLDGVYYAPAAISASESTITIGADVYLIVEDVNQHAWSQFMAIKEA